MSSVLHDEPTETDVFVWLAETHRNHDLVRQPAPGAAANLRLSDGRSLRDALGLVDAIPLELVLDYEPRALAVSSDGYNIAVGTKSGRLYLVTWDRGQRRWRTIHEELTFCDAVRALTFADERTLIVGAGEGTFSVFELRDGHLVTMAPPMHATAEHDVDPAGWFERFTRIVSLSAPGPRVSGARAVALGVTSGDRMHVLYRDQVGGYRTTTTLARALLDAPQQSPEYWTGLRVVDAVWAHGYFWVLSSAGDVLRYSMRAEPRLPGLLPMFVEEIVGDQSRDRDPLHRAIVDQGLWHVVAPHRGAEVRVLASCEIGLAVLVGHEVSVLRFTRDRVEHIPRLVPPARWVAAPGALDVAVTYPFPTTNATFDDRVKREHPLFMVVAGTDDGLRRVGWRDRDPARRAGPSGAPTSPHNSLEAAIAAGSRAMMRDIGSVLYVSFGRRGRAAFLVCGTRQHRLLVLPVLDRDLVTECLSQIGERLDKVLRVHTPMPSGTAQQWWSVYKDVRKRSEERSSPAYLRAFAGSGGVARWLTQQRLRADFCTGLVAPLDEIGRVLGRQSADDLHQLASLAIRLWSESDRAGDIALAVLRRWCLSLLTRAREIGEVGLASALAKQMRIRLAELRRDANWSPGRWQQIGLFLSFLRKWIEFGYTYGQKRTRLRALVEWNSKLAHGLDAIAYQTRLLAVRSDLHWAVNPVPDSPNPAVWDIALSSEGGFSVHTHTDGSITAVTNRGRLLRWRADADLLDKLDFSGLRCEKHRLTHDLEREFHERYHHGSYSRSMLVFRTSSPFKLPRLHLLLFCLRGFREEDGWQDERRRPRLCAVLVRRGRGTELLTIVDVETRALQGELYGLCALQGTPATGQYVAAGGRAGYGPFVEIRVRVDGERITELSVFEPKFNMATRCAESDMRHNPCVSLAVESHIDGSTWVWAGYHDGHVTCYLNVDGVDEGGCWLEGGGRRDVPDDVAYIPLVPQLRRPGWKTSAAVWSLRHVPVGIGPGLIAYATADGVVGVVEVRGPTNVPRGTSNDPGPPRAEQSPHILHTRESSPICRLVPFHDGDWRLLALSQDGVASVFRLERQNPSVPLDPARPEEGTTGFRFVRRQPRGARIERFYLGDKARAVALVEPSSRGAPPTFVVGADDGAICKHVFEAPMTTPRRRREARRLDDLLAAELSQRERPGVTPRLAECVGVDEAVHWLCVMDVAASSQPGSVDGVREPADYLFRYSVWYQLRRERERFLQQPGRNRFAGFLTLLRRLAADAFRRRPFHQQVAKVIWGEGAIAANQCCELALRSNGRRRARLLAYYWLLATELDNLCDRWVGFAPSTESTVLMSVFNATFDWSTVLLLVTTVTGRQRRRRPQSSQKLTRRLFVARRRRRYGGSWRDAQGVDVAVRIRRTLLTKIVRRRLNYTDPLVVLESLRVINVALTRATTLTRNAQAISPLTLRPYRGWGLLNLIGMVSESASRLRHLVTPSEPLFSEVARFFAICLLLVPESVLFVGRCVSEGRFTEPSIALDRHVVAYAESIEHDIDADEVPGTQHLREASTTARSRLAAYLGRKRPATEELERVRDRMVVNPRSKRRSIEAPFLDEQIRVYRAVDALISRSPTRVRFSRSAQSAECDEGTLWLHGAGGPVRYFAHSHTYLRSLESLRDRLLGTPEAKWTEEFDKQVLLLTHDVDLFEPQRTHHEGILRAWRREMAADLAVREQRLQLYDAFGHELAHDVVEARWVLSEIESSPPGDVRAKVRVADALLVGMLGRPWALRSTKHPADHSRGSSDSARAYWELAFRRLLQSLIYAYSLGGAEVRPPHARLRFVWDGEEAPSIYLSPIASEIESAMRRLREFTTPPWPIFADAKSSRDMNWEGHVSWILQCPREAIRNAMQYGVDFGVRGRAAEVDVEVAVATPRGLIPGSIEVTVENQLPFTRHDLVEQTRSAAQARYERLTRVGVGPDPGLLIRARVDANGATLKVFMTITEQADVTKSRSPGY